MCAEGPARTTAPHPQPEREDPSHELERVKQSLTRQLSSWAALNEIAHAVTSTLDEGEVLQRVTASIRQALNAQTVSLILVDQDSGEIRLAASLSDELISPPDPRLALKQDAECWVTQNGTALLLPVWDRAEIQCEHVARRAGCQPQSVLCAPLQVKGKTIGALELVDRLDPSAGSAFTSEDSQLLAALATWVAIVVENSLLSRTAGQFPTETALKQVVVTLAHHVNNRLMAFSLELDEWEDRAQTGNAQNVIELVETARHHIWQISAVVRALNMLEEIRTIPYVGSTSMADIEDALKHQLRNPDP